MTMLHLQNLFSFNTRVPINKLFFENNTHFSSNFSYKIRSNNTSHLTFGIDHGIDLSSSNFIKALSDHQGDVLAKNEIGIIDFFEAKNLLVTGATGFLAKGNFNNVRNSFSLAVRFKHVTFVCYDTTLKCILRLSHLKVVEDRIHLNT